MEEWNFTWKIENFDVFWCLYVDVTTDSFTNADNALEFFDIAKSSMMSGSFEL